MPQVSVIIPNYNHARYLRQRIDSILTQTYTNFEVIILDDCSTDNSKEIIETYRGNEKVSKILCNETNSGSPFTQWEKGIAEATGQWIWIAESDDYAGPNFLETLITLAGQYKSAGIVFCGSVWVDDKGNAGEDLSIHRQSFFRKGTDEISGYMSIQCTVQNVSSAIIRRDIAAEIISGIKQYKACGDWIFYVKLLQRADMAFNAQKLNYFRWYHHNLSRTARENNYWLTEGIHVLENIDLAKVKFSLKEFLRTVRFWQRQIKASNQAGKQKQGVLNSFIKRYIREKVTW
ncbi:glycosyltransferase [Mucilaginibacter limnophilus]|uniref:Glycosyltransferase n=1 Tax=Mucilaginibacter limnophilus TaxID=1932778 RepID=A0A437ML72_9SPHI|nr:glycosyltransferase family 2 protein [Mucilaginibacter limnophilus]RVT98356.1 glycosyltransferase [Mucilaginibacter limnophilus]